MQSALEISKKARLDMNSAIEHIAQLAHQQSPHRSSALFREFLPKGYRLTTLSSVSNDLRETNLLVKCCIGTIITLYDDLADHPSLRNRSLLAELYRIPFNEEGHRSTSEKHPTFVAIHSLWSLVLSCLNKFPHYQLLYQAFEFDVLQFFSANRYSEVITDAPFMFNREESRNYSHHNMGIVIVGMIDLMCSPVMGLSSIGQARAIFFEAQKAARIMNMLVTLEREEKEGDITNELVFAEGGEQSIQDQIRVMEGVLRNLRLKSNNSFSVLDYVDGMEKLYILHKSMRGII